MKSLMMGVLVQCNEKIRDVIYGPCFLCLIFVYIKCSRGAWLTKIEFVSSYSNCNVILITGFPSNLQQMHSAKVPRILKTRIVSEHCMAKKYFS
jgi:hypothetical protein